MIDVVGHFGSRFSYATHASELAHALLRADRLARCVNLDDVFLEDYAPLGPREDRPSGVAAIVITAPTESIRPFAACYDTAALFVCPNTDQLSDEAIATAECFDRLIVPSGYCMDTVANALAHRVDIGVTQLPLGVADVFVEGRRYVRERATRRRHRGEPRRAVHFTSDAFWPGRKGTEELIEAWPGIKEATGLQLTIHSIESMRDEIYYYCADRGMHEPDIEVVSSPPRGAMPHQIFEQMAAADLVIHPSRAEGYGMIALSALCAGVPLVTTSATGEDFLRETKMPYVDIAVGDLMPLHGELGSAPEVTPWAIRNAVIAAGRTDALQRLRSAANTPQNRAAALRCTWTARMGAWRSYADGMLETLVERIERIHHDDTGE